MNALDYLKAALLTFDEDRKAGRVWGRGECTVTITEQSARWLVEHIESLERAAQVGISASGARLKSGPKLAPVPLRPIAIVPDDDGPGGAA